MLKALEGRSSLRDPGGAPYDPLPFEEADQALIERVAALLSPTPTPRDDLARATGASAPKVYAALMELALAGRAELLPGGLVAGA